MKNLIVCMQSILLYTLLCGNAYADSSLVSKVVAYSGEISVYSSYDESEYRGTLSSIIARQINLNTMPGGRVGESIELYSSSTGCYFKNETNEYKNYQCYFFYTDGTYIVTEKGFKGPETESSISIEVDVKKKKSDGKVIISKKALMDFAG